MNHHNHSGHQNRISSDRQIFNKHAGHSLKMFSQRFWVSFILTLPIFLYSVAVQEVTGIKPPFYRHAFIPLILSSIIFFYGGWPFISGAKKELKEKNPGMMTLVSLAIIAAYFYSIFEVIIGGENVLFRELSSLVSVMLLGHWLEMKAVSGAQSALDELSRLLPDEVEIEKNGNLEKIYLSELKINDIVFIRPGSKIPADGVVIDGDSTVDESIMTGESRPIKKTILSEVIAGSVNIDGILKVKITKIGENTFLSGVVRLVKEAEASKSKLQILSDKAAFYLTIIAIISGIITFLSWLIVGGKPVIAFERLVAVLVIACPHALGLAVPLVVSISTVLASKSGFLVKKRIALESAKNIDIVLFDKTGTLTKGKYGVSDIISVDKKYDQNEILALAASLDVNSEHPAAKAIVKEANSRKTTLFQVNNFFRIAGKGVKGSIKNREIIIGGENAARESIMPEKLKMEIDILARQGKTIIYVLEEGRIVGIISLSDIIRTESYEAVKKLKSMGIKVAMITGDSNEVAEFVSKNLGIGQYFAKVLPGEKSQKVKLLQGEGLKVAMVGDGINDAPALVQADLGVAIGAGTNIAIESAGIILVKNDPRDIAKIITLSKVAYKKMIQNIFWATGYNVVALPLAAGVLASKGILLQPAIAAIFMSLSTIIVAINAVFLRKIKLNY